MQICNLKCNLKELLKCSETLEVGMSDVAWSCLGWGVGLVELGDNAYG